MKFLLLIPYLLIGWFLINKLVDMEIINICCNYETCYNKKIWILVLTLIFPITLLCLFVCYIINKIIATHTPRYYGLVRADIIPSEPSKNFKKVFDTAEDAMFYATSDYGESLGWCKTSNHGYVTDSVDNTIYYIYLLK